MVALVVTSVHGDDGEVDFTNPQIADGEQLRAAAVARVAIRASSVQGIYKP